MLWKWISNLNSQYWKTNFWFHFLHGNVWNCNFLSGKSLSYCQKGVGQKGLKIWIQKSGSLPRSPSRLYQVSINRSLLGQALEPWVDPGGTEAPPGLLMQSQRRTGVASARRCLHTLLRMTPRHPGAGQIAIFLFTYWCKASQRAWQGPKQAVRNF